MAGVMANPEKLPWTFGIEIEMLFVFDEEKIRTDPAYQYILPEKFVQGDGDDLKTDLDMKLVHNLNDDDVLRKISAMKQAANILRHKGLDLALHVKPNNQNKKFNRWMLTTESHVLDPQDDDQLARWSEGRLQDSEPLSFHGGSMSEVARYANVIAEASTVDEPYQFISNPENAGVHVHIGLRPKDGKQVSIPVDVLRHLAWIIVCFENVMTLLHHPERHGYGETKIISRSNRTTFGSRQWAEHHSCRALDMEAVFLRNFTKHVTDDQDLSNLKEVMCSTPTTYVHPHYTKFWFVNFFNIKPGPEVAKLTVEFRQHHGTLDANDLREWVIFVTALMRTAERKANESKTKQWKEAAGTPNAELEEEAKYSGMFDGRRTLKELFDLMGLPIERRSYWWERAKKFRRVAFTLERDYDALALCLGGCGDRPQRDCEGWAHGELDLQPW
ncbi:hypothetical protein EDD37DRAFT_614035 [Exophiala viscosa]|uniref:uncharacterized protein n=1 Tax=Exophiala viscosa TaxID=2486360 RepID=UPI00219403F1|nr:hypothetical protein EDD37DRAFT_614035 [Exophiala viscosa]